MKRIIRETHRPDGIRYLRDCPLCLLPMTTQDLYIGVTSPYVIRCHHCTTEVPYRSLSALPEGSPDGT